MADVCEVTDEMVAKYERWIQSDDFSEAAAANARRFPPWKLFRMQDTGQRVTTLAFADDGTIRVLVSGEYNFLVFERQVYGIDPNNLEECDLPLPNERLGVILTTDEELDSYIGDIKSGKSKAEVVGPRVRDYIKKRRDNS